MGYWNQDEDGSSLCTTDTGLLWGDQPADILDDAIIQIRETFIHDVGRPPSNAEIKAGLLFSLGVYEELTHSTECFQLPEKD